MARTSRLWVPVLVGCLVAGLVGVGGGGAVAVEPRTVTASIMIPTAAFIPAYDGIDYYNNGQETTMGTAGGTVFALLSFPVPVVSIRRITVYAYDNTGAANVCAGLYRSRPPAGARDFIGEICTVDSTTDPQTVYTTQISPRQVNTAFHGPYLSVSLSAPGVKFYGVKVTYTYDPGA